MTIDEIRDEFSRNGWTITKDTTGRVGQRIVEARRVVDGVLRCLAESTEIVGRQWNRKTKRWDSIPTGSMEKPNLRPCFAPGVIL